LILIDANLLIYAYIDTYQEHQAARIWLNDQLNGDARVGLPWLSLLAFLRVSTNRRIHANPATMEEACIQMREWLALEAVWIPQPGARQAELLTELLRGARVTRDLTSDAHIAALAIEHGLTICSADTDFARFPDVRWMNPLTAARR
jgi:toxin-antitoxin system PIN domain toxin